MKKKSFKKLFSKELGPGMFFSSVSLFLLIFLTISMQPGMISAAVHAASSREDAMKDYKNGNYKDAFVKLKILLINQEGDPRQAGKNLNMAVNCLTNLNRAAEADDFREQVISVNNDNWHLLFAAAQSYAALEPYGYMIAGEFHRGHHRGGGKYVNSVERDRVRALQLMDQAVQFVKNETDRGAAARFYIGFADMLLQYRGAQSAWRMQYLTDLSELPDYEEGYNYGRGDTRGAPVDTDGNPIFHSVPASWENAETDGERWRWLLTHAEEIDPGIRHDTRRRFADFLYSQFGVQTLAHFGFHPRKNEAHNEKTSIFSLHTLKENETIARLANGIKRFELPDEFNYIRIYKEINRHDTLAHTFENRQQYPKAAHHWEKYGNHERVKQITGSWGVFEPVMTQPAADKPGNESGSGATVDFKFRNGNHVRFEAHEIHMEKLLEDIKGYIRSNPRNIDWHKEDINSIGYRIVHENETRYVGKQVADWSLELSPRPHHFDRRITVTTPLYKPGAYLLTGKMKNGNTSRIIIWINDTVIVKKNLDQAVMFHVADTNDGHPVADANLEFFGYHREWRNKFFGYRTDILDFAEYTGKNGQVIISETGKFEDAAADGATFSDRQYPKNMPGWSLPLPKTAGLQHSDSPISGINAIMIRNITSARCSL